MISEDQYNVIGAEGFIKVFPDILTKAQCNTILKSFKDDEWAEDALRLYHVNYTVGDVKGIAVSTEQVIYREPNSRSILDENIRNKITTILHLYRSNFLHCEILTDVVYLLLKFEKDSGCSAHVESTDAIHSELTCSIVLSDSSKGGHWVFFNGEKKVKVPQGSAIVYPSNFMYPVELSRVKKGTKYILTTWLK